MKASSKLNKLLSMSKILYTSVEKIRNALINQLGYKVYFILIIKLNLEWKLNLDKKHALEKLGLVAN